MKVEVIAKFKDKHTKELHKKGDVLEITEERFAEISAVGNLVKKIEEAPAEDAPEAPAEDAPEAPKKSGRKTK